MDICWLIVSLSLQISGTYSIATVCSFRCFERIRYTIHSARCDHRSLHLPAYTNIPRLASGAFLLMFGRVADLFGRKLLLVGSMFLFAITCIGAGFSKSGIMLDILSGLMGLFSASAVPPAQGILGVLYEKPSKRKNTVMACFSAGNPLGFAFGMVFPGIATQLFNWRAGFWLLAINYLVFTIIAFCVIPEENTERAKFNMEAVKKLDVVGTLLTTAGVGTFIGALR